MKSELTPTEIVQQLDKYIVGQKEAKKAVAIAIRNRWRRMQLDLEIQRDIIPKNIIMIGPTGVGKTEIARRIAQLIDAPFIKVEATKYTEVGYHGRDVESMIRDLVKVAYEQTQKDFSEKYLEKTKLVAEETVLDILVPKTPNDSELSANLRESFRTKLIAGDLDHKEIEIKVEGGAQSQPFMASFHGMEDIGVDFQEMISKFSPSSRQTRRVTVKEALKVLANEATKQFVDNGTMAKEAIRRVENSGIIFIDEIDKVAGKNDSSSPDISRGGVQRDLLPIVEGSAVSTKQGMVNTDHILFIAEGDFQSSKPSELMPELQGRFPIRVELESLKKEDYVKILLEPKNSLIKQYVAMLSTENVDLEFEKNAIEEIAEATCHLNEKLQNIGARRLYTVLEKILQDVSFAANDYKNQKVIITGRVVKESLKGFINNDDLSKYIL